MTDEQKGLVSVIIPVYNVEQYLDECVQSVLRQTYRNLEIILVDDGSTDRSGELCDGYAAQDKRIRCIHQPNGGLSRARNEGLRLAEGEFVYFLDSDDWIEPDSLQAMRDCAVQTGAALVFFDAVSFFDNDEAMARQSYLRSRQYDADTGLRVFSSLQEAGDFHSPVQLLFLNRSFLLKNELHFEEGIVYEDMLYTFQAFCLAELVAHINLALYHKRYRLGSITHSVPNAGKAKSSCRVYLRALSFAELHELRESAVSRHIIRCAFNALEIYRKLPLAQRSTCKTDIKMVRQSVLAHHAFGSLSLRARCFGYIPWAMVRGIEKVFTGSMRRVGH